MIEAEVLRHLNFQFTHLQYSTNSEVVYSGTFENSPVVFKVLPLPPDTDYNELEKESRLLLSSSHENIVQVHHSQWVLWNSVWYFVVVMEACAKSLAKDVEDRRRNTHPYSEKELWNVLVTLVRAFAHMQRLGLAHQDIKPENIFLSYGIVKIGGFGAAKSVHSGQISATLTGTETYLSPLLRHRLLNPQQQVVHNVFKSDVYALGLTLYALASLLPSAAVMQRTDTCIQRSVWTLNHDEQTKSLIQWMLTWNEEERPDFVQMDEWIKYQYPQTVPQAHALAASVPTPMPFEESKGEQENIDGYAAEFRPDKYDTMPPAYPSFVMYESAVPSPQTPLPLNASQQIQPSYKLASPLSNAQQLHCLYCRSNLLLKDSSVQLKCSPDSHVFCSVRCFSKEVERQQKSLRCPSCRSPIAQDDLDRYCVSAETPWFGARLLRTIAGLFGCHKDLYL